MPEPTNFQSATQERCRCLRSKEMFVHVEEPDWDLASSGSGIFWCVHTQNCLGPDDHVADPDNCRPGRGCFEPL